MYYSEMQRRTSFCLDSLETLKRWLNAMESAIDIKSNENELNSGCLWSLSTRLRASKLTVTDARQVPGIHVTSYDTPLLIRDHFSLPVSSQRCVKMQHRLGLK